MYHLIYIVSREPIDTYNLSKCNFNIIERECDDIYCSIIRKLRKSHESSDESSEDSTYDSINNPIDNPVDNLNGKSEDDSSDDDEIRNLIMNNISSACENEFTFRITYLTIRAVDRGRSMLRHLKVLVT